MNKKETNAKESMFLQEFKYLYRYQETFFTRIRGQQTKITVCPSAYGTKLLMGGSESALTWNVEGTNSRRDFLFTKQMLINAVEHDDSVIVIGGTPELYQELSKLANWCRMPCTRRCTDEITNLDIERIGLYAQLLLVDQKDFLKSSAVSSGDILEMLFEHRKELVFPDNLHKIACCVCGLDKMYPDERIFQIMLCLRDFDMRLSLTYENTDSLQPFQNSESYVLWKDCGFNSVEYISCKEGEENVSIFLQSNMECPILML